MNSFRVGQIVILTGGTIALYLLFRRFAHSRPTTGKPPLTPDGPSKPPRQTQGVILRQIYPGLENDETEIDIIAIHGLDTDSSRTWTWEYHLGSKQQVNWLTDPNMLPARCPTARIFTCDWPASLFREHSTIEMTTKELARSLLLGIQSRREADTGRPTVFIASCLGGIILSQALAVAAQPGSGYTHLWESTRGVVFLATPFRGTAFQDIATFAVPFLKVYAGLADGKVTDLLESVKSSTQFLQDLVTEFTQTYQQRPQDQPCQLAIFYETKKGNLLRKGLPIPQFADRLKEPKLLVDSGSARLDIVPNPVALERSHVEMNKFWSPDDPGFDAVAGQIEIILCEIRKGRPIEKADLWVRNKRYTADRLVITRLSGDPLPMDQCYINLAIVERLRQKESRLEDGNAEKSSPFSFAARQNIEEVDEDIEILLPSLFEERKLSDGPIIKPRRILIRGRAGVGKTTLCKKMVHDFVHHGMWNSLFDRILWVPLRNLKKIPENGCTLKGLFLQEYFSDNPKGGDLAQKLWDALDATEFDRTLFALDGLDEISDGMDEGSKIFNLVQSLLNLPNVIVTSRPHRSLPHWLKGFDLELDTIGFSPDQVKAYVAKAFIDLKTGRTDPEKTSEILGFLQSHYLVQGLVRIPIQLDALCSTWDDHDNSLQSGPAPETMTAVYRAIEQNLWKKDAVKLEKQIQPRMQAARRGEVSNFVKHESRLLEVLAFTGMHNDIIDFGPRHRDAISEHFPTETDLFLDEMLARLSFLRTSDPSADSCEQNYHFLHLTFQEYFAAKYFVRQWKEDKALQYLDFATNNVDSFSIHPLKFLQKHKYDARYDIVWRFAAGLLQGRVSSFFNAIEERPLDLLGPTHQRLVMHCLNEVDSSTKLPNRRILEENLLTWLLLESELTGTSLLVKQSECPAKILSEAIKIAFRNGNDAIEEALRGARTYLLSETVWQALIELLKDEDKYIRSRAAQTFGWLPKFPDPVVKILTEALKDEDEDVRSHAAAALGRTPQLSDLALTMVAELLKEKEEKVRFSAVNALKYRSQLPDLVIHILAEMLCDDDNGDIRSLAAVALSNQSRFSDRAINLLTDALKNDGDPFIRSCAAEALGSQSNLLHPVVKCLVEALDDGNSRVRSSAAKALGCQSKLPDEVIQALIEALSDEDNNTTWAAAEALKVQSLASDAVAKMLTDMLKDKNEGKNIRVHAAELFGGEPTLPDSVMESFIHMLNDEDKAVRIIAAQVLRTLPRLPKLAIRMIAEQLRDRDEDVRSHAAQVFELGLPIPESAVEVAVEILQNEVKDIQIGAIEALEQQQQLADPIVKALEGLLKDKDQDVRFEAARALRWQSQSSDLAFYTLVDLLRNEDDHIQDDAAEENGARNRAAQLLGDYSTLPDPVVQQLAELVKNADKNVRRSAAQALRGQSQLSHPLLEMFVELLKDEDNEIRSNAAKVLARQPQLPDPTIEIFIGLLDDKVKDIRTNALKALEKESQLPDVAVEKLVDLLADEEGGDLDIRSCTIAALGSQSQLLDPVIGIIARLLKDKAEHRDVRVQAAQALRGRSNLSVLVIDMLAKILQDKAEEDFVLFSILKILGTQPQLPDSVAKVLTEALRDKDQYIQVVGSREGDFRETAADVLMGQPVLSDPVLGMLEEMLHNQKGNIRYCAAKALRGQSQLPDSVVMIFVRLLDDGVDEIEHCASIILSDQSRLPEPAIKLLLKMLKDGKDYIRNVAAQVLGNQSHLSDAVVRLLADVLVVEDVNARYRAAEALGCLPNFSAVTFRAIGLVPEAEMTTSLPSLRNASSVTSFYGVWLCRSFKEQLSMYIDDGSLVINQADKLWRLSTDQQFEALVDEGRQLWNVPDRRIREREDAG